MISRCGLLGAAPRVADQALQLLLAPNTPQGQRDLLLMPDQMMLQIHESIGHPLELDRILGDERNYAGTSFVKQADFGHLQYGSRLLNVTFDPDIPEELASYGHDDEGTAASKQFLIREGLLVRPWAAPCRSTAAAWTALPTAAPAAGTVRPSTAWPTSTSSRASSPWNN